jgi:glycosyltransferase involved in cell wall biosynthesis
LTADPALPVPPTHYGGIERIVDMLARGLAERGHEVTLFANARSSSAGRLVPWPGACSNSKADSMRNAGVLAREVSRGRFHIVHSFSRLAYLLPVLPWKLPKLMTYQRAISPRSIRFGHILSRGTLQFTAISQAMMESVRTIGKWHLVYNGVPLAAYDFRVEVPPGAPLVFLGRVEEIKGPHLAVEVAKMTGLPLVIAGNIPGEHRAWFEQHIAPHIDGRQISYAGAVNDQQKNELLGRARALLMPILWEEPFGIVMAEAMACGTPVIGFRRGAVPEVVQDGVSGYVAGGVAEMAAAVSRLGSLDRWAVREHARQFFSAETVVDGYLSVYEKVLSTRS